MRGFIGNLSPVALDEGTSQTAEIQVFKQGKFRKNGRNITVGPEQIKQAVENFNNHVAGEPPLDYDHEFAYGGSSAAAGWFKALYEKDGALWATVEFTREAAEKVREKVYRFFSPEFHENWADETGKKHGFVLLAGGLTNRPFLKNMAPVTLSEQFTAEDLTEIRESIEAEMHSHTSERGRDMGLFKDNPTEDKATIEALTEEVNTLKADASKVEALTESVDTLTAERDDLKTKLSEAESNKDKAETTVEALTERVEQVEKERFEEKLSACFTAHRKRGAIDAKDETTAKWTTRAEKHGVDFIEDLLSDIPDNAAVPMDELGHGNDNEGAPKAPVVTLSDGRSYEQDPEQYRIHQRAEKLVVEKNITYDEAVDLAVAEVAS